MMQVDPIDCRMIEHPCYGWSLVTSSHRVKYDYSRYYWYRIIRETMKVFDMTCGDESE